MPKNNFLLLLSLISLTSCNLYGGIDTPSGDEQVLSRARGCLDRGDYACATEYYGKLSTSQSDTRLAETALVAMAQDGVFSISDLVASLGDGRGSATSFTQIANYIAKREKTSATYRVTLDRIFVESNSISNASLRNYTQFLIALAMTNQILASISGSDATLSAGDISSSPAACRSSFASCGNPGSFPDTSPGGTPTSWTGASTNSQWGNPPSVDMFIVAAATAQNKFAAIGGSNSGQGIIQALQQLGNITGAANVKRQALLTTLF